MLKDDKAFSLAELSIVLIIIGLLVAGVSGGSKLIQQAKLRALMNEMQIIETAIKTFVVAYDAKPGDYREAGLMWGASCGGNSAAPAGCNGNGDGIIQDTTDSGTESFRFWQHLQLSEIINKTFTGVTGFTSGTDPHHTADNSYESKFTRGLLFYIQNMEGDGWSWESLHPNNNFRLNKNGHTAWGVTSGAPFTPFETHAIDKKYDDGLPESGTIMSAIIWDGTAWDTKTCWSGTTYNFSEKDGACYILISGKRFFGL